MTPPRAHHSGDRLDGLPHRDALASPPNAPPAPLSNNTSGRPKIPPTRWSRARWILGLTLVGFIIAPPSASADTEMESGGAMMKLGRGFVNIVTGWVEIPKRINETTSKSGTAAGLTWGLLRGLGYGFIRTAAGVYELVTFPVPAPPNYASVIEPEYVFTQEK